MPEPEPGESEERSRLDEALDLLVFAPIGIAVTAVEELPELVRKGRATVEEQMGTALVIGRVAVKQGKVELSRIASQWNDLGALLRSGVMNPKGPGKPTADSEPAPAPAHSAAAARPAAQRVTPPPDDLGIPGYASLSASQVVKRLDGLTPTQLAAVKAYEGSSRRRRTILGRIDQLQAGTGD